MKRIYVYFLIITIFMPCIITAIEEKPIIVIIPSYNNSQWCKQNIDSVIHQNYNNYHILFIDDCSTDTNYQLVKDHVEEQKCAHKITLYRNKQRNGALMNLCAAIQACQNNYIVLLLDGDDWLTHNDVLARVNCEYANPHVWLTYGQFIFYPENRLGECKQLPDEIITKNSYREYDWCTSHLRTFYAGLFKKIKQEDLIYNGAFFDVSWDRAFMYPMLEMAAGHIAFIPDILYSYNCENPNNDFKTKTAEQFICAELIKRKQKYEALIDAPYEK